MAVRAIVHADQWHRRLGHINARRLEILNITEPQQIGASERDGRTLAGVTRWILKDSGLPILLSR